MTTNTTIVGNLTADPEVRFTHAGTAVCNFTVASTPRRFDRDSETWVDGDTLFLRCTTFGTQAERMVEELTKGARVMVTGSLEQHTYTDADGNTRISIELDVDEVAASLRFAPKTTTAATRDAGNDRAGARTQPARATAGAGMRR